MTKLTLELDHEIYSVEFKNSDVEGDEYIRALFAFMTADSFSERDILNAMDDFLTSYDYKEEQDET